MSEREIEDKLLWKSLAKRKIELEVDDLRFLLILKLAEKRLRQRLANNFDPLDILQLNAVEFLINSMDEKSYPPHRADTDENVKEAG